MEESMVIGLELILLYCKDILTGEYDPEEDENPLDKIELFATLALNGGLEGAIITEDEV